MIELGSQLHKLYNKTHHTEEFIMGTQFSSVQFSCSVISGSLWAHGLQHARLPCPSPSPRACSKSCLSRCPSSLLCHPTISSSVIPFSSCLQSFPALGSFLRSQYIASGGQNIGNSASSSVLPMNIQDWFPLFIFFSFIFISWRLITLQYSSGFCHTLTWISYGFTCVPHPNPPSHLPSHPIPLDLPSAPALSTCLMHPTWVGGLLHPWQYTCFSAILSEHPTLAFSLRVPKSVLYICVSLSVLHIGLLLPSL